jgi:hypothetical protein
MTGRERDPVSSKKRQAGQRRRGRATSRDRKVYDTTSSGGSDRTSDCFVVCWSLFGPSSSHLFATVCTVNIPLTCRNSTGVSCGQLQPRASVVVAGRPGAIAQQWRRNDLRCRSFRFLFRHGVQWLSAAGGAARGATRDATRYGPLNDVEDDSG